MHSSGLQLDPTPKVGMKGNEEMVVFTHVHKPILDWSGCGRGSQRVEHIHSSVLCLSMGWTNLICILQRSLSCLGVEIGFHRISCTKGLHNMIYLYSHCLFFSPSVLFKKRLFCISGRVMDLNVNPVELSVTAPWCIKVYLIIFGFQHV